MNIEEFKKFKARQAAVEVANAKILSLRAAIEDATGEPALTARCLNFSQFSPQAAAELVSKLEAELTAARVKKPEVEIAATPPAPKPPRMRAQLPAHLLRNKTAAPPAGPDLATLERLATRIFNGAWRVNSYNDLTDEGKMDWLKREFWQAGLSIPSGMTSEEAAQQRIRRIEPLSGVCEAVRLMRQQAVDKFFRQNKNQKGA